jgi:hypothetical protein
MVPANIREFGGRPPRRSVLTIHRRWDADVRRQLDRGMSGRFVWSPAIRRMFVTLTQKEASSDS